MSRHAPHDILYPTSTTKWAHNLAMISDIPSMAGPHALNDILCPTQHGPTCCQHYPISTSPWAHRLPNEISCLTYDRLTCHQQHPISTPKWAHMLWKVSYIQPLMGPYACSNILYTLPTWAYMITTISCIAPPSALML